jgi:hypothetical protein
LDTGLRNLLQVPVDKVRTPMSSYSIHK